MTSRFRFVLWAVGLYAVWTLATYLLEGRIVTLFRPLPARPNAGGRPEAVHSS